MRHDHLISARQLSRADIESVLDHAATFDGDVTGGGRRDDVLGLLFFEPSTRT
ncbi:MAG: aspartate carbamoyltransferase, partial [Haloarculaceae archaeon]